MTTFSDWRSMPDSIKVHLRELEQFIGDVDGKMLCSSVDDNSVIDEGVIDAEDAVKAVNGLMEDSMLAHDREAELGRQLQEARAEIERLQAAKKASMAIADERSFENMGLRGENEKLRAALKPFADLAQSYEDADAARATRYRDEGRMSGAYHQDSHRVAIGLGDCRAARRILEAATNIRAQTAAENPSRDDGDWDHRTAGKASFFNRVREQGTQEKPRSTTAELQKSRLE